METKTIAQSHEIRGVKIENRIGFAPMGNSVYTEDSFISEKSIELYSAIAGSGTGLLVQGCAIVAQDARSHGHQLGIWSDSHIAGLRRLTRAVHVRGKKVIAQLQHCGLRACADEPLGPSAISYTVGGKEKTSRAMSLEDIKTSRKQFLSAALRAVQAGYDGVELHCSHGWLISSFLSGVTNLRADEYGKDKLLYLREVFRSIRESVPENFIVGVRMSGYVPDLDTGLQQAREMEKMGVDYISVSVNYKVKFLQQQDTVPEGYPFDPMIYAAHEIKKVVKVPVFAAKGIRNGEMANRVLAETGVDMVLVGKGHLCDPQWASKALSGKEPVRCLDCKGECRWSLMEKNCPALILAGRREK